MKKVEYFEIKECVYPKKASKELKVSNLYKENSEILLSKMVIDETLPLHKIKEKISQEFKNLDRTIEKSKHEYYFLKLFLPSASKDAAFNKEFIQIEKYFNKFKTDYNNLLKKYNFIQKTVEEDKDSYLEIYYVLAELYGFISGLNEDVSYFQANYFPQMKVTAFNLCNDKTSKELEELNEEVTAFVSTFKNFEEAFDFICYNSGALITDVVNTFVESLKQNNRKVSNEYFLDSDVVIAFTYIEWVNLMRRIQFIKKKFKNDELSDEFIENYNKLEIYYTVILIFNAMVENNER